MSPFVIQYPIFCIVLRGAYLFILSCNIVLNHYLSNELCVILRCSNVNGSLQCVRLFG